MWQIFVHLSHMNLCISFSTASELWRKNVRNSKRVRLCFANWIIFFMQLTAGVMSCCCLWQWHLGHCGLSVWTHHTVKRHKRPAMNTSNPSTIPRCARIVHFRREAWVDVIFHILLPSLWIPPTPHSIPCPDCLKGYVLHQTQRGGGWWHG